MSTVRLFSGLIKSDDEVNDQLNQLEEDTYRAAERLLRLEKEVGIYKPYVWDEPARTGRGR